MIYPSQIISIFFIVLITSYSTTKNKENNPPTIESQALYDTNWELEYISGPRIAFDGLFPDKKPVISFDKDTQVVRGNAGCNGNMANFTLKDKALSFGDPGPSTMMYWVKASNSF